MRKQSAGRINTTVVAIRRYRDEHRNTIGVPKALQPRPLRPLSSHQRYDNYADYTNYTRWLTDRQRRRANKMIRRATKAGSR